ncbi:hypothetical protein EIP91_005770 [Steccherinum ochraceum]|uniref:Cytochrome c oxidase copper chaperone n=1 Tax=Steccherinum ochraceum TaxID=92696 RepID=A0A4R0R6R8_9APHY|nr:hypothetical protein EIP91_005770 [Steccherinum ochraceum]
MLSSISSWWGGSTAPTPAPQSKPFDATDPKQNPLNPEGLKPCCACPQTKAPRDDCFFKYDTEVANEKCKDLVAAHIACMRGLHQRLSRRPRGSFVPVGVGLVAGFTLIQMEDVLRTMSTRREGWVPVVGRLVRSRTFSWLWGLTEFFVAEAQAPSESDDEDGDESNDANTVPSDIDSKGLFDEVQGFIRQIESITASTTATHFLIHRPIFRSTVEFKIDFVHS